MTVEEMQAAVEDAERTLRIANRMCSQMARLLRGRLREVDSYVLKALKRELQQFKRGAWE